MALSSAVAQEGVSRVSSYITSTLVDVASRENRVHMVEMAVSRLELAIERSGKLPITDVSLLRRRLMIQRACTEGKELLRKIKQQQQLLRLEDREEVGQAVTTSSFLGRVTHAANRSILSLLGFNKVYLSSSAVKKFEMFAECADKFLQDVESGCTLRQYMFSNNSLVRLLFEWRTLGCRTTKGTFLQRGWAIWATRSEEHGVEATLVYVYDDPKLPEKSFVLKLGLRLSESTDIVGTAIRCLQPLVTRQQLKVAAESAIGELSQQVTSTPSVPSKFFLGKRKRQSYRDGGSSNLLELSPSREHALFPLKKYCALMSPICRLVPVCCRPNEHGLLSANNNTASSESSHMFPEEVNFFAFNFNFFNLRRSSYEAGTCVMLNLDPETIFVPHFNLRGVNLHRPQPGDFGSNRKSRLLGMQEWLDTLDRQEPTHYGIHWFSKHVAALFDVKRPTTRRSAKRKR